MSPAAGSSTTRPAAEPAAGATPGPVATGPGCGATAADPPALRSSPVPVLYLAANGKTGRAARAGDDPFRRRLRRRHAADGRPFHQRDGADRQRPLDAARLPGRDPRAGGLA